VDSPLTPVIANFFMGDFEELTVHRTAYEPTC